VMRNGGRRLSVPLAFQRRLMRSGAATVGEASNFSRHVLKSSSSWADQSSRFAAEEPGFGSRSSLLAEGDLRAGYSIQVPGER
jgi:hypothetical protein